MSSHVFARKMLVLLIAIFFLLLWFLLVNHPSINDMPEKNIGVAASSSEIVAPITNVEDKNQEFDEGVYLSADRTRVSVNFTQMPRLAIIQHVAEVAGFDFSLPDQDGDYWSQPLTVSIKNEPLPLVLSTIIGAKKYTVEMAYDAVGAFHKISAVFLSQSQLQQVAENSPLGKNQSLPFEREATEAPPVNFSTNHEQKMKRENFFAADEQSRVAILQEMSPVGEDLRYIITSLLQDKNPSVRLVAAQRLSFSESYTATQSLLEALSDSDSSVVQAAMDSLVSLGDPTIIPLMEAKLGATAKGKVLVHDATVRIQSRFTIATDSSR